MIPVSVSLRRKRKTVKPVSQERHVLCVFILLIYVVLSLPFHFLDKLNPGYSTIFPPMCISTSSFIVFIVFALSFFGLFDITLPASLSGTADRKAGLGNIMGIFMALTLAIVSFSCTGPILGSLLAGSLTASGGPN